MKASILSKRLQSRVKIILFLPVDMIVFSHLLSVDVFLMLAV